MRWLSFFLAIVNLLALAAFILIDVRSITLEFAVLVLLLVFALVILFAALFESSSEEPLLLFFFAISILNFIFLFLTKSRGILVMLLGISATLGLLTVMFSALKTSAGKPEEEKPKEKLPEKKEEIEKELAEESPIEESSIVIEEIPELKKVIGSLSAKTYHEPECPVVRRITKKNKVVFDDNRQAKEKGYKPHECTD